MWTAILSILTGVRSRTRKVLLQCPQEMRAPDGWGSGLTGPGCTGPRLMILLLHTETHVTQHSQCQRLMGEPPHTQMQSMGGLSYQYGRGQAILWEVTLQIRRQLHGQRTYFFPAGAFLIGCSGKQEADKKPIIPDSWKGTRGAATLPGKKGASMGNSNVLIHCFMSGLLVPARMTGTVTRNVPPVLMHLRPN